MMRLAFADQITEWLKSTRWTHSRYIRRKAFIITLDEIQEDAVIVSVSPDEGPPTKHLIRLGERLRLDQAINVRDPVDLATADFLGQLGYQKRTVE
jgi:hypothetical protein